MVFVRFLLGLQTLSSGGYNLLTFLVMVSIYTNKQCLKLFIHRHTLIEKQTCFIVCRFRPILCVVVCFYD